MISALVPFAALMVAAFIWWLVLRRRYGAILSLAAVTVAAVLLVVVLAALTPALPAPFSVTVTLVAAIAAAAGVGLGRPWESIAAARPDLLVGLAAATGSVIWFVAIAVATAVPDADPLSWAMSGDAVNNLTQARDHSEANGLTIDNARAVAVPLTGLLLALALGTITPGNASARLAHDLEATSAFWSLEIAVTSALLAIVVCSTLPRHRALTAAAFSLLGLTWLVTGLPIESGYLNTHLGVSLLLLSWLAFTRAAVAPWLSVAIQFGIVLLVLASWSPLVVVPVALLAATTVLHRESLRSVTGWHAVVPSVSAAGAIVYTGVIVVPALMVNSSSLGIIGHGFPSTAAIAIGAIIVSAVVLVVHRGSAYRGLPLRSGLVALSSAAAVGFVTLLYLGRQAPDPLSGYYPTKFVWMVAVVLAAVALSIALAAILATRPRHGVPVIVAVAVAAIALASIGPAPARRHPDVTAPPIRILGGEVWTDGDASARLIVDLIDSHTMLYRTDRADEAFINYWLLVMGGGGVDENITLRAWAVLGYWELRDTGRFEHPPVSELCGVITALGPSARIVTADTALRGEIEETCGGQSPTITVDDYAEGD